MAGETHDSRELIRSLRASEASYRELVEAANSIILRIDCQGRISFINRFGLDFFGFEKSELIGASPVGTIVPLSFSDGTRGDSLEKIMTDPGAHASHNNENIKKDGTRVWISWSNRGVYDNDGALVELLCVGNDITRLKEMEAELSSHRQNLESLVRERTQALDRTTGELVNSQNRLMLLNTISDCIIQEKTVAFTICQVLDQVSSLFTGCGAAYSRVSPGASILTFDFVRGSSGLPDISGQTLFMADLVPLLSEMIQQFQPYLFCDMNQMPEQDALAEFVKDTGIRAGMVVPIHQSGRILGLFFIYAVAPKAWTPAEKDLMVQVANSLSVAIRHRQNKNRLMDQEQFLENIFDGVDVAIFVLSVTSRGIILFENVNEQYETLWRLVPGRVIGTSLDSLSAKMGPDALKLLKKRVARCVAETSKTKFIEEIRGKDGPRYWLTRLTPIIDNQGRVFRIIGVSTDISEQKQAETALIKNEARLREAQRIAKLGDCERDITTQGLSCSDQLYNIFGWDSEVCPGHEDFLNLVHPEDRGRVRRTIDQAIDRKRFYDVEYRIVLGDGTQKIVNEIGEVVLGPDGCPTRITGIVQDITEQKQFKDEIELARKVFDNAVEGVVVTDRRGTIQFVNKGFTKITGYSEAEAVGQSSSLLKSDRHDRNFYTAMWKALDRDGHWSGEIWNRRKNGEAYPEWLSITAINDHQGEPARYMSVFNDLSDIRAREDQLRFQANFDALTGLPNRTLLTDRLQMAIRRTRRSQQGLAVIFMDLDDFKHVNDALGHAKGDQLLQMAATRLLESVREQDTVARYGGDEFIILIPDTNESEIITLIIERIQKSLKDSFVIDGKDFFIGVSIGITLCPQDGTEPDTLIANADMAMYRSKEVGKGRYAFFTPELNRQVARRVELAVDLRLALDRQEFTLYFQPKLDIKTNRICGAEALIRWEHPEKGLVSPGEFIPLAEETGLINPMGEWILNEACAKARQWSQELGRPFSIAVNISSRQVRDVDLVSQVKQILAAHCIGPEFLELEITESAVMGNVERAKTMFRALHDLGINISIDDFGTGFSSLSYLRLFPVTTIKIDKSFVDDIPGDPDSNTMVTTIISMARHLNLMTVAEGVEKKAQLDFLATHQCDQIQGYYFSAPIPAQAFFNLLRQNL